MSPSSFVEFWIFS